MSLVLAEKLYTVQDYHKMAEVGIIQPSDRVELLNGKIFKMSPISSQHSSHVKSIAKYFIQLLNDLAVVGIQDPVIMSNISEPEPDISILKPNDSFYHDTHPTAKDTYLLIEVSLATLKIDRTIKLPIYAAAGVTEYWIVNLEENVIEIYKNPIGKRYKFTEIAENEDIITIKSLNAQIKVSDLLL